MDFNNFEGFEWDEGNFHKNWIKHKVTFSESEEIFFNEPLIVAEDIKHSTEEEKRFFALGKTNENRKLYVVFTKRIHQFRIISARDMSKKERNIYNEEAQENT